MIYAAINFHFVCLWLNSGSVRPNNPFFQMHYGGNLTAASLALILNMGQFACTITMKLLSTWSLSLWDGGRQSGGNVSVVAWTDTKHLWVKEDPYLIMKNVTIKVVGLVGRSTMATCGTCDHTAKLSQDKSQIYCCVSRCMHLPRWDLFFSPTLKQDTELPKT